MFYRWIIWCLALPLALMPVAAFAETPANRFSPSHGCAASADQMCELLRRIKNPTFAASPDLIILPHRGYWGFSAGPNYGSGPPENSTAAVNEAIAKGYRIVEMDIMPTNDGRVVSSHDYPLFRFTNYQGYGDADFVFQRDSTFLSQLLLRKRNGDISDQSFLFGEDLASLVRTNHLVLVLDPKEPIGRFVAGKCVQFCEYEAIKKVMWLRLVKRFIAVAQDEGSLANTVIKTELTPQELIDGVTQAGQTEPGLGQSLFAEVLWVPELLTQNQGGTIAGILSYLAKWERTDIAPSLAFVETDFFNPSDAQLHSFQKDGVTYSDILDYLRRRWTFRGGIFSEEPVVPRGTLTRWAVSKMKNSNADRRADHLWLSAIPNARSMVITTDRPDVWEQFQQLADRAEFQSNVTSERDLRGPYSGVHVGTAAELSPFDPNHYCSSHRLELLCKRQDAFRSMNPQSAHDYLLVPHRGLWGIPPGADVPENSERSISAAASAGYIAVEIDMIKVKDGYVASHDFLFPRITDANFTNYMWDHNVNELRSLHLRARSGQITDDNMLDLNTLLSVAKRLNMVVMIDTRPIKAHFVGGKCIENCDYIDGSLKYDQAYIANLIGLIDASLSAGVAQNLVFKVPFPKSYVADQLGARFSKVLWMPQLNPTKLNWFLVNHGIKPPGYKVKLPDLLDFVDEWGADSPAVSCFETAYGSANDMRLQPFVRDRVSYVNSLEYVVSRYARRPGTFSGEPVGQLGLVNEYLDWRMVPDVRADHLQLIKVPFSKFLVITSDRPDVWHQFQSGMGGVQ